MQSASIDGNQHAPRILRCTSGERFPIVEHTQWRDQYEASRVAISRNQSPIAPARERAIPNN
jgi:hypothetical protein